MDASNIKHYLSSWEQLRQMTDNQNSFYHRNKYLLENGQEFNEVAKETDFFLTKTAKQKQCYRNSLLACVSDSNLHYVEGFYDTMGLPLDHAWNIDGNNVVHDFTAVHYNIDVKGYFGIVVPKKVLERFIMGNKRDWITPLQFYYEHYLIKKPCQKKIA